MLIEQGNVALSSHMKNEKFANLEEDKKKLASSKAANYLSQINYSDVCNKAREELLEAVKETASKKLKKEENTNPMQLSDILTLSEEVRSCW